MRNGMTYPEILGQLHQMQEAKEAVNWTDAELVAKALNLPGVTVSQMAHDLGCSKSHVSRLARTYHTFPTPESRWNAPNASFSHHRICSETDRPDYWLHEAATRELSTRDLQAAIKLAHAEDPQAVAFADADRAIQRVRATWQQGDAVLRDHMRGPLRAFVEAELS